MRKSKLIELLNNVPGNPEVVVWNGLVDDIVPIKKLVVDQMVKESREYLTRCHPPNEVEELLKQQIWEFPNSFVTLEEYTKHYGKRRKNVIILEPKVTGKTYSDRIGKMYY